MKGLKKILLFFSLFLPFALSAQESKNVLFIGNSYTEVNNLPQMVADIAASMGDQLTYSSNTPGGCTFQQHCTNQSMTLIRQGRWDAVVMQEQSQYPSFPDGQVEAEVFPYAQRLVDSIYAHGWCTEPMFYMTWGRRDGDTYNAQYFPVLGTYEGMDSMLCLRYLQMASDNDASVCPVGRVWRYLRRHHSEIELYQSDGSHPSVAGTYAAACSFYTMLFHRDPTGITYRPSALSPTEAQSIRQATRIVIYDTLPTWQRRQPSLQIVEVDTPQYMGCSFVVECEHCDTLLCSWGDGNDTLFAGTPWTAVRHTYADTGLYTISLTATRHCIDTMTTKNFHAVQDPYVGINDFDTQSLENLKSRCRVYPNPATDKVHISVIANLELYSLNGWLLRHRHADIMTLEGLPTGVYLLSVDGTSYRIVKN